MNSHRRYLELGCADYEQGKLKAAARKFLLAARLGSTEAQVNLANMYDAGEGVKLDPQRAVHYYKLAVRKGSPEAAYNLSLSYKQRGNYRWAYYWMKRASELGDADANEILASKTW